MNKQNLGLIILGLLVIGIIIFYQSDEDGRGASTADQVKIEGSVTNINLDQIAVDGPALITIEDSEGANQVIAVPSMGINLCQAADQIASPADINVLDLVQVSGTLNEDRQIVPCEQAVHYLKIATVFQDQALALQFTYPVTPRGYELDSYEPDASQDLLGSFALYQTSDRINPVPEGSESYPNIAIRVYDNVNKYSPSVWSMNYPRLSNENLIIGSGQEEVVGGANAYRFKHDGLWPTDAVIVAPANKIYVLSAPMINGTNFEADFANLLDSITFIAPINYANTKIDVTTVCRDSLIYTTFTDSEASDQYVADCIDGKHPEVIERYLKSLDLDGAAI